MMFLLFLLLTLLSPHGDVVAATFINDSDTIDIEYIGGTEQSGGGFKVFTPPPQTLPPLTDPFVLVLSNDDEEEVPPAIDVVDVEFAPEKEAEQGSDTTAATPAKQQVSLEVIIEILATAEAIQLIDGGPNVAGVRLLGGALRDALRAQGIRTITLPTDLFFFLSRGDGTVKRLTQEDFTLVVAAASLRDESLAEVTIRGSVLVVRYQAPGRLFGFIPLRYPLVTTVVLSPSVTQVDISFPWYSFFLAKGISEKELKEKMSAELITLMQGGDGVYDLGARAFKAVSEVLIAELGEG